MSGPYGSRFREMPRSRLFLYLQNEDHARTWLHGGDVPLRLASSFLSLERKGIFTPDEVRQFNEVGASISELERSGFLKITGAGGVKDLEISGCHHNGWKIPATRIDDYREDAFVLCFSKSASRAMMKRFGNKKLCVEVNFQRLIDAVKSQTTDDVYFGDVAYTNSAHRSHFMKSALDQWQNEYRVVLPNSKNSEKTITIPPVATLIGLE